MRREITAGARLLLGTALLVACGDGDPEPGEGGSIGDGDGDSTDGGDEPGGGTASGDVVVEGGFVLCGNPLDCPDSGQDCRKEDGERVGYCVECEENDECADGEYCAMGQCADSLCEPGELGCADTDIVAACNEDGTGFVDLEVCETGACAVVDGVATCDESADNGSGGGDGGTGGSGDGGGSTGGSSSGGAGNTGGTPNTGGSASMPGPNLITNGDFENGNQGWDGGTPVENGQACVSWNATLGWNGSGSGATLEAGSYTLSFSVSGSGAEVEAKVGAVMHPFEPVLLTQQFTASSQDYSYDFTVGSSQSGMGLAFNVTSSGSEFCLDDVELRKN